MQADCEDDEHFSTCPAMEDVGDCLGESTFTKLGKLAELAGVERLKHFRLPSAGLGWARLGVTLQQRPE